MGTRPSGVLSKRRDLEDMGRPLPGLPGQDLDIFVSNWGWRCERFKKKENKVSLRNFQEVLYISTNSKKEPSGGNTEETS